MRLHRVKFGLLCMLLLAVARPGDARGAWPDGDNTAWNLPGMAIPRAPIASTTDPTMDALCQKLNRQVETDGDAAVVGAGWRLMGFGERGVGIEVVGGYINVDAMCRPVPYQWFVFVGGRYAGTLAPAPMLPRSDGSLVAIEIVDADRLSAVYDRYNPMDPLCCPSAQTEVMFTVGRSADGPVVIPEESTGPLDALYESTTPVCVGLGGDGLSLVDWTDEELAAHEARFGPALRAHPATGTCSDPAGVPLGVSSMDSLSWLCASTADGRWYGPYWMFDIYRMPDAVPPDPMIGGCPTPRDRSIPSAPDEELAAATAVYLSQLEAVGDVETLYAWLHPDAKLVAPEAAVTGWYTADFLPLGPQPIRVNDVEIDAWAWGVTGTTYERTAIVSFEQMFADGTVSTEVVRLVQDDRGTWCWFFGRTPEFLAEQIDRYAD